MEIGRLAAGAGLSVDAVRYYEKAGLLAPPSRDAGGRRQYGEADAAWLTLVVRLRRTGMPVREVRRYVELARAGDTETVDARLALLEQHRAAVQEHLDQVRADLAAIDTKIDLYRKA